jgi:hypothetical protein
MYNNVYHITKMGKYRAHIQEMICLLLVCVLIIMKTARLKRDLIDMTLGWMVLK